MKPNSQDELKRAEEEEAEQEERPDAVQLAIAAAGALLVGLLYLTLPERVIVGPSWLPLVLESVLLAPPLVAVFLVRRRLPYRIARGLALGLLAVVMAALITSVVLLVVTLPSESPAKARALLGAGAMLWVINILVFGFWYWEIDGGGPLSRVKAPYLAADLQFPQQQNGNPTRWVAGFIDYLFVAFCFSTALSPADTSPLTRRAKVLMMAQAGISLMIIGLLIARSVNILT
jgi:hypothetical protein